VIAVDIRRLTSKDFALAVTSIKRLKPASTTREIVSRFLSRSDHHFIAAVEGGKPVGFALVYELQRIDQNRPMMFLYEIGVSEAHRRRGVGRAMIEHVKRASSERNAHKVFVIASRTNEAALRLYDSAFGAAAQKQESIVYSLQATNSSGE